MFSKLFRLIGFILALALVCFVLLGVWIVYDGIHDDYDHADIAFVPGYQEIKDATLSPELMARLDRANHLYGMGKCTHIVVSGTTPQGEDDEADAMAHYLEAHNVPASVVIEDHRRDKDPVESIAAIMKEREAHSLLLITEYFRLTRMKLELEHAGVKEIEQAHTGQWRKEDNMDVLREDIAICKDLYHWYLLPATAKVSEKATEEEKKLKDKVNNGLDSLHK